MKQPKFQIGEVVTFICHAGDSYTGHIIGVEIAYSKDYISDTPQYGYRILVDEVDVFYAAEQNMRLETLKYMKRGKNEKA